MQKLAEGSLGKITMKPKFVIFLLFVLMADSTRGR